MLKTNLLLKYKDLNLAKINLSDEDAFILALPNNESEDYIDLIHRHNPKAIIIDPNFLNTLPKREIISGIGEILKYGIIQNKMIINLFDDMKNNDLKLNYPETDKMIINSIQVKIDIVIKDVNENGLRRILNFGHTVGHIIEASTKFNYISHGEAIMHGMIIALRLSEYYCKLDKKYANRTITLLKKLIKTPAPKIEEKKFLNYLIKDKKVKNNKVNFILLKQQGLPVIRNNIEMKKIFYIYQNHYKNIN